MVDLTRRQFLQLSATSALSSGLVLTADEVRADFPVDAELGSGTKVPMRCRMCAQQCPILGHVVNGTLVRIETNPKLHMSAVCARGVAAISALYSPDRIKTPLIRTGVRGKGEFRSASWEEALTLVADKLKSLVEQNEARSIAYMPRFTSAAGLDWTFFQALGTPNRVSYADTCWATSNSASLGALIGGSSSGVPNAGNTAVMHDYINAKYAVNLGRNPGGGLAAFCYGSEFGHGRANQLKVTTVDPRYPSEAGEADQDWIPIRPGTDQAFLLALINLIITQDYYDKGFLANQSNAAMLVDLATAQPVDLKQVTVTSGDAQTEQTDYLVFDEATQGFVYSREALQPALTGTWDYNGTRVATGLTAIAESVREYTPEWCEAITGVMPAQLQRVADNLNANKPSVYIERGWRTVKYDNALQERLCVNIVNALMGSFGAKGGTIRPWRISLSGGFFRADPPAEDDCAAYYRKTDPNLPWVTNNNYRRLYARGVLEDKPYKHRMLVIYGQNPVGGSAGGYQMVEALEKLEMVVAITPFHSDTTMYADVILPECTFMERDEAINATLKSPFRAVAMHRKAVEPLYESKPGYWIFNQLAKRVLPPEQYASNWGHWEEQGIQYIWDKQLADVRGLSAEEQATFRERLFRDGVWSSPEIRYGFQSRTATGKVEIYATSFAKLYQDLQKSNPAIAETAHPALKWTPPYWYKQNPQLARDEFVPISAFSPLSSFTGDQTRNNPMLKDIGRHVHWDAVFINATKGRALGLDTGDKVQFHNVEKADMPQQATVVLTELVHPDAMFFYYGPGSGYYTAKNRFGRYAAHDGMNPNHISHTRFAPIDGGHSSQDFVVKIRRA